MATIKTTKRDKYNAILAVLHAAEANGLSLEQFEDITYDTLTEFIDHELAVLSYKKSAKDEDDALCDRIYEVLTDEAQTIDSIRSALNEPSLTPQKVVSRLRGFLKENKIAKESIRVAGDDGRSKTMIGYKRI